MTWSQPIFNSNVMVLLLSCLLVIIYHTGHLGQPQITAPVAQLVASTYCISRGLEFDPITHTFVEIDHKITSTVILPLLLIQEGLLSVTG